MGKGIEGDLTSYLYAIPLPENHIPEVIIFFSSSSSDIWFLASLWMSHLDAKESVSALSLYDIDLDHGLVLLLTGNLISFPTTLSL